MFQFHKVRLKDADNVRPAYDNRFQFHKVRLKVRERTGVELPDNPFQFHKVRLKVFRFMCWLKSLCSFNSIRYD